MALHQIQGTVFSSYEGLAYSTFLVARIRPGAEADARRCLAELAGSVTYMNLQRDGEPQRTALNVALTYPAFVALGAPKRLLDFFPVEFVQGMFHVDRARALGDDQSESTAPASWRWGNEDNQAHVLFMVYGRDEADQGEAVARLRVAIDGALDVVHTRSGQRQAEGREHFGFVDGRSQPRLVEGKPTGLEEVPLGEFVLGYRNVYGDVILEPDLVAAGDVADAGDTSLVKNGSFLVAREIDQDVPGFWRFLEETTRRSDGSIDPDARDALAAKMVGRTKDGEPISPPRPGGGPEDFDYRDDDGRGCPIGAHIRRANPRASIPPDPQGSIDAVRARRLLRRGRSYGKRYDEASARVAGAEAERGLTFVCLSSNIRRQFEFVQQTWLNNIKFGGLYDERDPLVGSPSTPFTIPDYPVRRHVVGIPAFTRLRGGAYFFLPSRRALEALRGFGATT